MTVSTNSWRHLLFACALLLGSTTLSAADTGSTGHRIGVVVFRKTIEDSKLGKQQATSFETLQNQMEATLLKSQKEISEIATKLNDDAYLDGLTPEAENELKHKYRTMSQELQAMQSQFIHTLQEANTKIVQAIASEVSEAAKEVGKTQGLDAIINDEAVPYHKDNMDVTRLIVAQMDVRFDKNATNPSSETSNSQQPVPDRQNRPAATKNSTTSNNPKTR